MVCVPTLRADVENVATPEALRVPGPRTVAPSRKLTVPVGVPAPGAVAVTVAVNVTDAPTIEGLLPETSAVEVAALFTTCESAAVLVLVPKFESPPYAALRVCVPTESVDIASVAELAASGRVPSVVALA